MANEEVPEALADAVRALAADARVQIAYFPHFVVKADELALCFEEHFTSRRSELAGRLSSPAVAALDQLDAQLAAMSGPANAELWTDDALRISPQWAVVRERARTALRELGLSNEPPRQLHGIYVGPPGR